MQDNSVPARVSGRIGTSGGQGVVRAHPIRAALDRGRPRYVGRILTRPLGRGGSRLDAVRNQRDARRWRQVVRAIVVHPGPLDRPGQPGCVDQLRTAGRPLRIHRRRDGCAHRLGPGRVRVLVPRPARVGRIDEVTVVVHLAREWTCAQALREVDFLSLCRRFALPLPHLQAVRASPGGKRRYLVAEETRADRRGWWPRLMARCTFGPRIGWTISSGGTRSRWGTPGAAARGDRSHGAGIGRRSATPRAPAPRSCPALPWAWRGKSRTTRGGIRSGGREALVSPPGWPW